MRLAGHLAGHRLPDTGLTRHPDAAGSGPYTFAGGGSGNFVGTLPRSLVPEKRGTLWG